MIPDYCEPLTGYRCWNVFPNGLMVGQAHSEPWAPFQPFLGRCGYASSQDHVRDGVWMPAPVLTCDCGVHALKNASDAEQRLIDEIENSRNGMITFTFGFGGAASPKGRVWGAVKLWGRVIEHEIGYRAELAYPSALFCQDEKMAAIVSALYGVPCEVKTLAIPEPKKAEPDDMFWTGSQRFYQWYSGPYVVPANPAPSVQQPGLIQQPTLAAIKSLGASQWQKKQAQTAISAVDWRDVMKKAFHVKKDVIVTDGA